MSNMSSDNRMNTKTTCVDWNPQAPTKARKGDLKRSAGGNTEYFREFKIFLGVTQPEATTNKNVGGLGRLIGRAEGNTSFNLASGVIDMDSWEITLIGILNRTLGNLD